jgi:hypothetical protein
VSRDKSHEAWAAIQRRSMFWFPDINFDTWDAYDDLPCDHEFIDLTNF